MAALGVDLQSALQYVVGLIFLWRRRRQGTPYISAAAPGGPSAVIHSTTPRQIDSGRGGGSGRLMLNYRLSASLTATMRDIINSERCPESPTYMVRHPRISQACQPRVRGSVQGQGSHRSPLRPTNALKTLCIHSKHQPHVTSCSFQAELK